LFVVDVVKCAVLWMFLGKFSYAPSIVNGVLGFFGFSCFFEVF
jgi:hypothetical protein